CPRKAGACYTRRVHTSRAHQRDVRTPTPQGSLARVPSCILCGFPAPRASAWGQHEALRERELRVALAPGRPYAALVLLTCGCHTTLREREDERGQSGLATTAVWKTPLPVRRR